MRLLMPHSRPSKAKLSFVEDPLKDNSPGTTVIGDSFRDASQFLQGCRIPGILANLSLLKLLLVTSPPPPTIPLLLLLRLVIVAAAFVQIH